MSCSKRPGLQKALALEQTKEESDLETEFKALIDKSKDELKQDELMYKDGKSRNVLMNMVKYHDWPHVILFLDRPGTSSERPWKRRMNLKKQRWTSLS